jgi:prevent-host-death family protein
METPMRTLNIHAAKTQLSRLVEDAAAGEEIVIAKAGKPVARLCPLAPAKGERILGRLRGKIAVPDNFDDPLPDDVLALFEGR